MNSYRGQARVNGDVYLKNRRTILLGISVGNSHYFKNETLEKLFQMAEKNSDKVLIFITDKLSEHNYKAVGSKTPETSARRLRKRLSDKCKRIMDSQGCSLDKFRFINWVEDVEPNPHYHQALKDVEDLYKNSEMFRHDIQEMTKKALACFLRGRGDGQKDALTIDTLDIEEGVKYILKEIAFFSILHHIYEDCEEYVHVYHRATFLLDKYFEGFYDGQYKPNWGSYIF